MALTKKEIANAAELLLNAKSENQPIAPVTELFPKMTIQDSYNIQLNLIDLWKSQGQKVVGKKVGLSSEAAQKSFRTKEPALGHLFSDMLVQVDQKVETKAFYQPRVEGELALVLEKDLMGPGITSIDVIRATAGITAALEIMDTRIIDWNIKVEDLIADNCSGAAFVLGTELVSVKGLNPRYLGFVMEKNGLTASVGAGANVLGNPIESAVWLINKLAELELSVKAGEIILTGAAAPSIPVTPRDSINLTVDRVGRVACHFQ